MSTLNKNIILSCAVLASVASSSFVQAVPFALEARSLGMGNTSVATADIATAALANPGMLSYQQAKEDFSLLLAGGIFIDDNEGMLDLVDSFQANFDNYLPGSNNDVLANAIIADANALNGKTLDPNGVFSAVVGFSFKEYSLAFSARSEIVAAGGLVSASLPANGSATTANADALMAAFDGPTAAHTVDLNGTSITELGLSGAKSFTAFNRKISVGITPKIVSVESYTSSTPLAAFDTDSGDLIENNNAVSLGEVTTIDVGFVSEISERTQVGLVIKNLIEDELVNGLNSVNINRQVRLGLAYRGDLFTIGMDLDLVESDPVIVTPTFQSKITQMASLGMEFNAWDFLQIRLGAQKNLADNPSVVSEETLLTAGVGIWIGVNIDVAVIAGEESAGVFVQTGFKF